MNFDGKIDKLTDDCRTLVLFRLAGRRYALQLERVERVIRAVATTPVPEAPDQVLGLINMAGRLLPVISLRRCLGLVDCAIRPEDQFMIVNLSRFTLALVVDQVENLSMVSGNQTVEVGDSLPGAGCRAAGLVKINGDIVFIYDLEKLISADDQARILRARAVAAL